VQSKQEDLVGALKSHQLSLAIIEPLAKSDQSNAQWQRDLGVTYERIGDVQLEQNDLAGTLKSFRSRLDIAVQLIKSDAGNTRWQFDLAVAYARSD
jgi:hypothetical protein